MAFARRWPARSTEALHREAIVMNCSLIPRTRTDDSPAATQSASPRPLSRIRKMRHRPNGLLAWGGDLSPERLIAAYARAVSPGSTKTNRSSGGHRSALRVPYRQRPHQPQLRKQLSKSNWRITADTSFTRVMRACAAPRSGLVGTWIGDDMIAAYEELHRQGHAHSGKCGTAARWSAAFTAWPWGGCSAASRCSRRVPAVRRSRWLACASCCILGVSVPRRAGDERSPVIDGGGRDPATAVW